MSCVKTPNTEQAANSDLERDFNSSAEMLPRQPSATPKAMRNGGRVKSNAVKPAGLYQPNNNLMAPHMQSPDYVQL